MKLAVVTQAVDLDDPILGATVPKLQALAERVDELVVLALRTGRHTLPENTRVKSIAAPSRALRGARFAAALVPERPDAVLAHMAPIYAVLAAPLRVPVLLWFTHPSDSRLLRAAVRVSRSVLTVDERSFPFATPKLRAIGHGIDVDRFTCVAPSGRASLRAVSLGRNSGVKRFDLIERAVARVPGVELELVGPGHARSVPWTEVPAVLAEHDVFVSATAAGSADKAVLEAAASCLPVLASSPAFATLLGEELRFDDEDGLVERLEWLKGADRAAIGRRLREDVRSFHSVGVWADRVLEAAR